MLVLARKPNQKIRIDEDISIMVINALNDTVTFGIKAPKRKLIKLAESVKQRRHTH